MFSVRARIHRLVHFYGHDYGHDYDHDYGCDYGCDYDHDYGCDYDHDYGYDHQVHDYDSSLDLPTLETLVQMLCKLKSA